MNIGVANDEEKLIHFLAMNICVAYFEAFFEMNIGVVEGGECGPSERGLFVTRTLDSLLASTSLL